MFQVYEAAILALRSSYHGEAVMDGGEVKGTSQILSRPADGSESFTALPLEIDPSFAHSFHSARHRRSADLMSRQRRRY